MTRAFIRRRRHTVATHLGLAIGSLLLLAGPNPVSAGDLVIPDDIAISGITVTALETPAAREAIALVRPYDEDRQQGNRYPGLFQAEFSRAGESINREMHESSPVAIAYDRSADIDLVRYQIKFDTLDAPKVYIPIQVGQFRLSRRPESKDKPQVDWSFRRTGEVKALAEGSLTVGAGDLPIGVVIDGYRVELHLAVSPASIPEIGYPLQPSRSIRLEIPVGAERRAFRVIPDAVDPMLWRYVPENIPLAKRRIGGIEWPELSLVRHQDYRQESGATLQFTVRLDHDVEIAARLERELLRRSPALSTRTGGHWPRPADNDPVAPYRYPGGRDTQGRYDSKDSLRHLDGKMPPLRMEPFPVDRVNVAIELDDGQTLNRVAFSQAGEVGQFNAVLTPNQADLVEARLRSTTGLKVKLNLVLATATSFDRHPSGQTTSSVSPPREALMPQRTAHTGAKLGMKLRNDTDHELRLCYVDGKGIEEKCQDIAPGKAGSKWGTYAGHLWRVRDARNKTLVHWFTRAETDGVNGGDQREVVPITRQMLDHAGDLSLSLSPVEIIEDWFSQLEMRSHLFPEERALLDAYTEEFDHAQAQGFSPSRHEIVYWNAMRRQRFELAQAPPSTAERRRLDLLTAAGHYLLWIHDSRRRFPEHIVKRYQAAFSPDDFSPLLIRDTWSGTGATSPNLRNFLMSTAIPRIKARIALAALPPETGRSRFLSHYANLETAMYQRMVANLNIIQHYYPLFSDLSMASLALMEYRFRVGGGRWDETVAAEMAHGVRDELLALAMVEVRDDEVDAEPDVIKARESQASDLDAVRKQVHARLEEQRRKRFADDYRSIAAKSLARLDGLAPRAMVLNGERFPREEAKVIALSLFERMPLETQPGALRSVFSYEGFITLAGQDPVVTDRLVGTTSQEWASGTLVLPSPSSEQGWGLEVDALEIDVALVFKAENTAQKKLAADIRDRLQKWGPGVDDGPLSAVLDGELLRLGYPALAWDPDDGWRSRTAPDQPWQPMPVSAARFSIAHLVGENPTEVDFAEPKLELTYTLSHPLDANTTGPGGEDGSLRFTVNLPAFKGERLGPPLHRYVDVVRIDPRPLRWNVIESQASALRAVEVELRQRDRLLSTRIEPALGKDGAWAEPRERLHWPIRRPTQLHGLVWPRLTSVLSGGGRTPWRFNAEPGQDNPTSANRPNDFERNFPNLSIILTNKDFTH